MSVSKKANALSAQSASTSADKVLKFQHAYIANQDASITVKHESIGVDKASSALLRGNYSWHASIDAKPVSLTYGFWDSAPKNIPSKLSGFSSFNIDERAAARLSLQSWSDVANIKFTEVSDASKANITFGKFDYSSKDDYAFGYYPNGPVQSGNSGQTWYNAQNHTFKDGDINAGQYGRQTITHEIGHTLGLKHPGDYDAKDEEKATYDKSATYFEDSRAYSIMSYFNATYTGQDLVGQHSAGPLISDIAAIQKLYGANMETRSDDTIYGFNSNTGRDYLTITSASQKAVFAVWDGGGNDTLDFSGYSQDQRINLNELSFSDVGGGKGNVSIAKGAVIENAIGGSGNDILIGNDADNVIKGGAGNDVIYGGKGADILYGGAGKDTFVYFDANESTATATDIIKDFTHGEDLIDLSYFNTGKDGDSLRFVDNFTGANAEIKISYNQQDSINDVAIHLADGAAQNDFLLKVVGAHLTQSDFALA